MHELGLALVTTDYTRLAHNLDLSIHFQPQELLNQCGLIEETIGTIESLMGSQVFRCSTSFFFCI